MSALPQFSDVDLLGNGKRGVDLDPKIANPALKLSLAPPKLNRLKEVSFAQRWKQVPAMASSFGLRWMTSIETMAPSRSALVRPANRAMSC
jgi:hypothetical protein